MANYILKSQLILTPNVTFNHIEINIDIAII